METAEAALAELGSDPTVLVIEDLHWSDAASTDVLRYLARRVETVPLAILLSYRDLEIGPRHAARQLLGDFASLDGLRTLSLQPLSVDAVAQAVRGHRPGPDTRPRAHRREPLLRRAGGARAGTALAHLGADTVLARIAEIEIEDLEILQLVACSPDRLDDRVLPLVGVDLPVLRRLDETTLLARTEEGHLLSPRARSSGRGEHDPARGCTATAPATARVARGARATGPGRADPPRVGRAGRRTHPEPCTSRGRRGRRGGVEHRGGGVPGGGARALARQRTGSRAGGAADAAEPAALPDGPPGRCDRQRPCQHPAVERGRSPGRAWPRPSRRWP